MAVAYFYLSQPKFGSKSHFSLNSQTSSGIKLSASIYTDKQGYKYVKGEEFEDAIFGMGFTQCHDRLWQLNFLRGLSSGRMAEVS
jgi:acyl-homoserine lactone acylase PvdQ